MSNITKFIFGANTDVGKTLVSAGLCRALAAQGFPVHYIKPLQTGTEFDEEKVTQTVQSRCAASADLLETQTLFSWPDPISPHLAAAQTPVTNDDVRRALQNAVRSNEAKAVDNWTIIETAGGFFLQGQRRIASLLRQTFSRSVDTLFSWWEMPHLGVYQLPWPHWRASFIATITSML